MIEDWKGCAEAYGGTVGEDDGWWRGRVAKTGRQKSHASHDFAVASWPASMQATHFLREGSHVLLSKP